MIFSLFREEHKKCSNDKTKTCIQYLPSVSQMIVSELQLHSSKENTIKCTRIESTSIANANVYVLDLCVAFLLLVLNNAIRHT